MATRSSIPHSWNFDSWPSDVYPGSSSRGKYIFRQHKQELINAGAVSRIGREIVFLGDRYSRFLEKQTSRVPGFVCPANLPTRQVE